MSRQGRGTPEGDGSLRASSAHQAAQKQEQQYPPFWNHKLHGTAYGNNLKQKVPIMQQAARVEVRPGVLANVQQLSRHQPQQPPSQAAAAPSAVPNNRSSAQAGLLQAGHPAAAAGPGRPASAHVNCQRLQQQQQQRPYEQRTLDMNPELVAVEENMRQQLRSKAAVHVTEKTVLLAAFAKALGKSGPSDVTVTDKVTVQQFIDVWRSLGLQLSGGHAAGMFNKYGQDVRGRMPVTVFVESLVIGGPRQLMLMSEDVLKGPFKSGQPATHTGKINYPQCKSGVWPPSNWDPRQAERSSRLPVERLELEWVYGYDTHRTTSSNIWVNCEGQVVTFAAAVCIVYDAAAHQQSFFKGHDDDICCLALGPDRRIAASGQLGKDPVVLVWDSVTKAPLARLQHGYGYRGIQALCFSSSGSKLASIATDNSHSLFIWDWSKGQKLMERKTQPGAPPAVYGVVWSGFEPNRLVTYGQNHMKFWTLNRPNAASSKGSAAPAACKGSACPASGSRELTISVDAGVYGKGKTHSVMSAVFLPSGVVLTGSPDGAICSWRGFRCTVTAAHARGPLQRRPDGTQSYGGVACLVLLEDQKTLLSGGADGHVLTWDVSPGDLGQCLQRLPLLTSEQQQLQQQAQLSPAVLGGGSLPLRLPPAIRALAVMSRGVYVAGTAAGDVWEVDRDPRILLYGQTGDLTAAATNPHYPHVFATISAAGKVAIWNAQAHKVWWHKAFNTAVDVLRFSPDGSRLAAAGHDKVVDIFAVRADGLQRLVRCVGHSSAVKHLDWSSDGSCIQSMDQAYELLYFDSSTGKQIKGSCRDTPWHTYSCCLGFPVMGIWPPDSDGTDINSLDRSPGSDLLLTADDRGKVKLFNWPCVVEDAPAFSYGGHSSHVTAVRWSADQRYAISTGGHDRAVFQWKLLAALSKEEKRQQHLRQQQQVLQRVDPAGVLYAAPAGRA